MNLFVAPSLALNAVVDFPIWISVIAVGGSAALYTSIVSNTLLDYGDYTLKSRTLQNNANAIYIRSCTHSLSMTS